jgi:hypothetical protein
MEKLFKGLLQTLWSDQSISGILLEYPNTTRNFTIILFTKKVVVTSPCNILYLRATSIFYLEGLSIFNLLANRFPRPNGAPFFVYLFVATLFGNYQPAVSILIIDWSYLPTNLSQIVRKLTQSLPPDTSIDRFLITRFIKEVLPNANKRTKASRSLSPSSIVFGNIALVNLG